MINIWGVASIVLFYLIILAVGIWAGRKKSFGGNSEEDLMLAGRSIGLFVGIFTMTATWVGGGYINGTAEAIYTTGLLWCQLPFGYSLSLVFGGLFFAKKMRKQGYVTMMDPFQEKFGNRMGGLLCLPALCGEVFWVAGILAALGATLAVIIDMDQKTTVIASAVAVILYTLFGGYYSVAYTDVFQLFCIFIGLWICIPFALSNPAVGSLLNTNVDWIGEVKSYNWGQYIDYGLLLICGGIPWQVYFQRVLSSKSASQAQIISYVGAAGCFCMAIPPVLIGAIAKVTDWESTAYGIEPFSAGASAMVLPVVMKNLTPEVISLFGLGAVSAAIMSSADSSILSAASMFTRNIYRLIFRPKATEREIIWIMRISVFVIGSVGTLTALTARSIYGLWVIFSDLVYVILFPQLLMVIHFKEHCNTYGSLAAYIIALVFRLGGGEPMLSLPVFIQYPNYDVQSQTQYFPLRTFCMLLSLVTLAVVSKLTDWIFRSKLLGPQCDLFRCVVNIPEQRVVVSYSS